MGNPLGGSLYFVAFIGEIAMAEKTYYERTQQLLRYNYNADLRDFNILTAKQLESQWPPGSYSPAEIVHHYADKFQLEALW